MKWMWFFVVLLVVAAGAKRKDRKKKGGREGKKDDMSLEMESLRENVSALWSEVQEFGTSRVMVHVHGLGDDPAETHENGDGTHVHIHMHMGGMGGHGMHGHGMGGHGKKERGMHGHGMHGHGMGGHGKHGYGMGGHGMRDHAMKHKEMMTNPGMMKGSLGMMDMHAHLHHPDHDTYTYGRCEMAMNPLLKGSPHAVSGSIFFRQKVHQALEVLLHLKGFHVPSGDHAGHHGMHVHGFHVHQYGDISQGCSSLGGHFNPDGVDHAGHDAEVRHAGDWGSIECDMKGEVHSDMNDTITSLVGPHSILGRGIVIHEDADDLGLGGVDASKRTGNAGGRLACCIVGLSPELDWDVLKQHHM